MLRITAKKKKSEDNKSDDDFKILYPKTTLAARYVLHEFLSEMECSEQYEGIPIPLNLQVVLKHSFSGTKFYGYLPSGEKVYFHLQIFHFTKSLLHDHLRGKTTCYYRSKRRQIHSIGYGNTDKQAQSLLFAKDLEITTRRISYPEYYVLLGGTDIDAHNGETDAEKVKNWVKTQYLHDTYWEKSTHGKGRHGYYKLAYPKWMDLNEVIQILQEVHTLLDQKRILSGYQCKIDVPCGLPSLYSYDSSIGISEINLGDIYLDYQNLLKKCISGNQSNHYTYYIRFSDPESEECKRLDKYPAPVKLKSSQCMKIPRFNASSGSCNMTDIITFHSLPYYTIDFFIGLRRQLRKELGLPETPELESPSSKDTPVFSSAKKNTGFLETFPPQGEGERGDVLPIVCTTSGMYSTLIITPAQVIDWDQISKAECIVHNYDYKNTKQRNRKKTFTERIEECRLITGKVKRTNRFCWYLSIHLREIPDTDTAIKEYLKYGLNENPDLNSIKRRKRFRSTLKLIKRKFDKNKLGLNIEGWKDKKNELIQAMTDILKTPNPKYTVKRGKQLTVKMEEIVFIYFVIYQSNLSDEGKSDDHIYKYGLSYDQCKNAMINVFGSPQKKNGGYSKNKVSKILQLLQQYHLIRKTDQHIAGLRGACYRVSRYLIRESQQVSA